MNQLMRIFAIRDEELPKDETLAYLLYYEQAKCFYIELPDDADPWTTPLLLSSFLKRGEYTINAHWSRMWVQQRIIPSNRQNLGQILKANSLETYDEFQLLMLANGRCAQDSCYIEEIPLESVLPSVRKRWEAKVDEVIPLKNHCLLVFFRDGTVRKCDITPIIRENRAFQPILLNDTLFCSVSVQTDGYGIYWSEQAEIDNTTLYQAGVELPISLDDFRSFITNRVVTSTEAAEMLDCSRQNIDDLTKRGKLHPIRFDTRNKLYLKNEVQQRMPRH